LASSETDRVSRGADTDPANMARVYDYWLGGSHNSPADRDAARAISAIEPAMPARARASRAFLGRAVRFLAGAGIDQFLDIGSGIPTERNTHEVAQQADPAARVAYVDVDPVAVAHGRAILAGNSGAAMVEADLREPDKILADSEVQRLIDFGRPAGLLLTGVLHFLADADDPWRIVATLRDALAPGSYLVLGHATTAGRPAAAPRTETESGRGAGPSLHPRSRAPIFRFFEGLNLVDPGQVFVPLWRPESPAGVPEDPTPFATLVGVARKK
jgi:SAM-dependent methyltransferase